MATDHEKTMQRREGLLCSCSNKEREMKTMKGGLSGGLVVGRRTCDLRVAGSRPGRDAAAQQPSASCSHPTASVTKQYNLVPAKAGK